jgi:mitogen-activated protein kinase 1/3
VPSLALFASLRAAAAAAAAADAPRSSNLTDLYVVSELMDTDLHKVIRSPQPLSDQHVQYFLYQLLRGLKYIHTANILHRDLKPSNLLVNENCDLKITDFGLSRPLAVAHGADAQADFLTEYVVTRWYRAPEVVLSSGAYAKAIDVWSSGCILAELINRKPLFAGNDHVGQLNCILDLLGTPSADECAHLPDKARRYILALPPRAPKPLAEAFPTATAAALELLSAMLQFDPARRCTVEEALAHPYLATFHNPALEPSAPSLFNFELERQEPAELLWAALCEFRPQLAAPAPAGGDAHAPSAGDPRRKAAAAHQLSPPGCKPSSQSRPRYKRPTAAGGAGADAAPPPAETMTS